MMSTYRRQMFSYLESWKERSNRKPLVLRGARRVGKTTLVDQFAKTFKYAIMLNLETKDDLSYFQSFEDVHILTESLFLKNKISMREMSSTLLFIDEIQESPDAINVLRYFYEEIPDLYVIAAGSSLEFAMKKTSCFPVGRVEFLYLYPFNFQEYLEASGNSELLNRLRTVPVVESAHKILLDIFNRF